MKLAEIAIWLDGTELPHVIEHWKHVVVPEVLSQEGDIGPITFMEKRPGDDRVPPVPDHIVGPDVRLLVAEAEVTPVAVRSAPGFVHDLTGDDLMKLRKLVRERYAKQWNGIRLTDQQCDTVIESLGPVAVDKIVRRKVDYHA